MATALRPDRLDAIAGAEERHPWFVARRAMVTGLVARHRSRGPGLVVDVGCGTGRTLAATGGPGDRRIGIDLLPLQSHDGGALAAAAGGGAVAIRADARRLPLADDVADVVIACDVLEHVVEHELVASEIRRVLRPDGVGVVTVPAHQWLWSVRDEDAGHVRRYRRETLRAVLTDAGLVVRHVSGFACSTLPGVAALRVLGRDSTAGRDREDRVADGPLASVLGRLLDAEARAVVAGRSLPTGSSLVAVVGR